MVSLILAEQDSHMVLGLAVILAVSMWPVLRNSFRLRSALPRSRAWMSFPVRGETGMWLWLGLAIMGTNGGEETIPWHQGQARGAGM